MSDEEKKLSAVEGFKEESNYLAGPIAGELSDDNPFVSNRSYELLKFHGSYQGYDRDTATERKKAGLEKEWEFMVRMKATGGRISAKQYLGLDRICDKYANGSLRITTRETFQFHCIVKENLKKHIAAINEQLLTTLGGCGDVVRNVMCTPAPIKDALHDKLFADAELVSEFTKPKTTSYYEIWLDGENVAQKPEPCHEEPLYGKTYLPRKFKISLSVPEDNSMDALTHDLAIVLIYEDDEFKGYNLCLGGGLGMTHNKPETFPRLASPIAFVGPDDLLKGVEAVMRLQSEHGDRGNRKRARLKYVVEDNGLEWTRKTLEQLFGEKMQDPRPMGDFKIVDHMGWHDQKDGKFYLGVPVSSGRIDDGETVKIRTALREIISKFGMNVVLTADQNIILCDVEENQKSEIEAILRSYGVKLADDMSKVDRFSFACVALPTCGKALSEAERVRIPMIENIENVMKNHGILDEKITVRIAGCPNGCSRPYVGDIGIVGRMPGRYALYIGGDFEGTRLNKKILDKVPYDNVHEVFDLLFEQFVDGRQDAEGFGDFANRFGEKKLADFVESAIGGKYKWAKAV